jgi:hypothetical protein
MTVSEPGTIYCRAEFTGTALVYAQWLASQAQRLMDKGELVDDAPKRKISAITSFAI